MNIPKIISDFQSNISINNTEVQLFRRLASDIQKWSTSTFIDETHGNVAQVNYTSVTVTPGSTNCEISDLLIVIKDVKNKLYRATFWQAKRELNPISKHDIIQNFVFKGQYNQWELLSSRPQINSVYNTFKPHKDLLHKASSPSIGSFGVFYENAGKVELVHSVAEMVSFAAKTIPKEAKGQRNMVINERLAQYRAWNNENIVAYNLQMFLNELSQFRIGALMFPQKNSADEWLAKYVNGKCRKNEVEEFFDDNVIDPDNKLNIPEDDGISVLLVSTNTSKFTNKAYKIINGQS